MKIVVILHMNSNTMGLKKNVKTAGWGLGLWCLTPLSTIVLLVEEAGVSGENHRPVASH